MRFHLDAEQEMLRDSLRRTIADLDRYRRACLDDTLTEDDRPWTALMDAGIGAILLPTEFGGSALGLLDAALAFECLGEGAIPGPFLGQVLSGLAVSLSDDPDLKQQLLPGLGSGNVIGAIALYVDDGRAGQWPAVVDGRLSGAVPLMAGNAHAAVLIVQMVAGDLVLVNTTDPGVVLTAVPSFDPTRPMISARFDAVPCANLAGERAGARVRDAGLVLLAADALGGAQRCLDMAVAYAKTREQFDRPIGAFQAVKHQLGDMALQVEPSRALLWYAAHAWDMRQDDSARMAAQTKAHLADCFVNVARAAIEAHGGIGYTWEFDLHIWFRRSLHDRAYLGSPALHRERAARLAGW